MTNEYSGTFSPYSRTELVEKIANAMSAKRLAHTLRVETMALKLADTYGADLEKVSIAALVHDYAKERPASDFLEKIQSRPSFSELINYNNQIWHGLVGAEFVREELQISDQEILEAVSLHTTGSAEMSLVAQLIYVADYIEEGRNFPGVDQCRELAFQDLAAAIAFEAKHTLQFLIEKEVKIYPKTLETYNYWVVKE